MGHFYSLFHFLINANFADFFTEILFHDVFQGRLMQFVASRGFSETKKASRCADFVCFIKT